MVFVNKVTINLDPAVGQVFLNVRLHERVIPMHQVYSDIIVNSMEIKNYIVTRTGRTYIRIAILSANNRYKLIILFIK